MDHAQTLRANLHRLPSKDHEFASSLLQSEARGILREKGRHWLQVMAERATATEVAPVMIGTSLIDLFATAARALKYPKIMLAIPGVSPLRLSVAGERARHPGSVNVTDTNPDREMRVWYGRVHKDGSFEASGKLTSDTRAATVSALQALAIDPAEAAANYGRLHGSCCFCNLPLTDARSTAVGYGQTCAKNYALPWGAPAVSSVAQQALAL